MTADLLISFLILLSILFFIPKLLVRTRIPAPVTEFFLGVIAALWLAEYVDEGLVSVFGMIGVVMIFFFAGIEAEIEFFRENKRSIILTILALTIVVVISGTVATLLGFTLIDGLLIGLVLTTPSAGFIISTVEHAGFAEKKQRYIIANALIAEIVAIFLLIIFLGVTDPFKLFVTLLTLAALITGLPRIIKFLYEKALRHIIHVEFPLFFVIALLSAYLTEALGLHFIIGAFIAGFIIKIFIESLIKDRVIGRRRSEHIMQGMNFLAILFVPFYFFNVGLQFKPAYFDSRIILLGMIVFLVVSVLRVGLQGVLQGFRSGKFKLEFKEAMFLLPTLMVGFVIADLLHQQGRITDTVFAVLLWYAVFTALTTIIAYPKRKK